MKKTQTCAVAALITPLLTLGSGCVPAQKSTQQEVERERPSAQLTQAETRRSGYLQSTPNRGMQANNLIGAEVRTTGDEDVGSVNDLIIGEEGQIVAVIVGVDGLLGLSQKNVAVNWQDVKRSITSEEMKLRIDVSLDELESAPAFSTGD
ncbi:PRC-barrel domain-containing protein [Marinimicrobium sp. C2-29]|uniref:PRC-barrel domain-containing protein n=1 Tax=Marinimicrobium sp. C2-29 TaxID=3139825 RepID=UPI00313A0B6B